MPGVAAAAISVITPINNLVFDPPVTVSGNEASSARLSGNVISPEWFDVYGIPLRSGRRLSVSDTLGAAPVAVVNEAFVRRYFSQPDLGSHSLVGSSRRNKVTAVRE